MFNMSLFILGVTLGQDSSVCNGTDSLHTGVVPKTAHNKLLTPKKNRTGNQSSAALVLLCRFCSPVPPAVLLAGVVFGACVLVCSVSGLWFFSSSLAPFWRGALLCCLRPPRLVLLRWGCFFLRDGDDPRTDHAVQVLPSQVTAVVRRWVAGYAVLGWNGTSSCTIGCLYIKSFVFAIRCFRTPRGDVANFFCTVSRKFPSTSLGSSRRTQQVVSNSSHPAS